MNRMPRRIDIVIARKGAEGARTALGGGLKSAPTQDGGEHSASDFLRKGN